MRRSIVILMTAAACAVWVAAPAGAATTWVIQATPSPSGATEPAFAGVSCPSATSCFAVGSDSNAVSTISQTLAERWNGSTWTIQATPVPSDADESNLDAVSCASATSCTAVGVLSGPSYLALLAEQWNGSTWTIQSTADPAGVSSSLFGISCRSSATCTAVGSSGDGALAEKS